MKVFNIGELIRHRRIECGFTQEQLCRGICEPPTMSRIERGLTTPSRSKMSALLQRLGMIGDKYYALLSDNELMTSNLQKEIMTHMVQRDSVSGLAKVEQLEQIMEKDDHILKQFILRARVAFGKSTGGGVQEYNSEERTALLYEAIRLTVPKFQIENIDDYLLGADEIQIINQIAKTYADSDQYEESINIYSRLMDYIEKHAGTLNQEATHSPVSILIAYNYSRALYFNGQYPEAKNIADKGLNYTKQLRNSSYFAGLLFIKAHCLYYLQEFDLSRNIFLQSFYMYQATDDTESASYVHQMIRELFHLSFED